MRASPLSLQPATYQKRHAGNFHPATVQLDSTWTLRHSDKFHIAYPTIDIRDPSRKVSVPTNLRLSDWLHEPGTPKHTVPIYDAKNQPYGIAPTSQCPSCNADSYRNHNRSFGNIHTILAEKMNSAHRHVLAIPDTSIFAHNPMRNAERAP